MAPKRPNKDSEDVRSSLLALRWAADFGYQVRLEPAEAKRLIAYISRLLEQKTRRRLR